jgi:hypothetical protein
VANRTDEVLSLLFHHHEKVPLTPDGLKGYLKQAGLAIVPIEPTTEMVARWYEGGFGPYSLWRSWLEISGAVDG